MGKSQCDRYLDSWVWKLNQKQSRILVLALAKSGYHNKLSTENDDSLLTVSEMLRDDFQRLCLHAGWACDYSTWNDFSSEEHSALKCLISNHMYGRACIEHHEHLPLYSCTLLQNIGTRPCTEKSPIYEKWVDYDGIAWCVSVPSQVFYMRRHGKSVWTGNSSRHGQVNILQSQDLIPS
jgi:hypothetical protein